MPVFYGAVDLSKNELRQAVVQNLTAAPASPVKGQLWMDSTNNLLKWFDGTAWQTALGSVTPPATTSALGTIQLAGDLGGTATVPVVRGLGGTVISSMTGVLKLSGGTPAVAVAADIPLAAVGAAGPMPANTTLDKISLPTNNVNMNTQLVTNIAPPLVGTDAANKNYVDATAQGLDAKQSVKAATTANLAALSAPQTVDGIALVAGDRVLVKNQTTASANGIYTVAAAAWVRATDMDAWAEVPGAFTFVEQGTVNADTGWVCTADQGGTLGTTSITWTQFSGAGSYTAGVGLTLTGTQFAVDQTVIAPLASPTFTGDPKAPTAAPGDNDTSIATTAFVAAAIAAAAVANMAKKFTATLNGTASPEVITHNLNTQAIQLTVLNGNSPFTAVEVDWDATSVNTATIRYNPALGAGYRVVIVG